ncbi:MAG TPA: TonB-dependent receptor [Opitutaceae bacterium]|nr:TonB-dependent receptor [Opitutaceae bacterium]
MNLNSVRKSRAPLALFLGVAVFAVSGYAQTTAPQEEKEAVKMEKFVTTGTRIGTVADQLDIPVVSIGAVQMQQAPHVELADYLRDLPAFTGAGNGNDSVTNGGGGWRTIDLRGLGSAYTLVLINGRPLAFTNTQQVSDVNQIPTSAIDHVEVLTSGASAVYGTNAIGGVVNVITKSGQNGGEVSAFYGDVSHTDLGRKQFAFSYTASDSKMDILVGAQYFKQGGVYSPDFGWSYFPGPTSNTFPYRMSMPKSLFTPGATGSANYLVKWKPGEGGRRDAASPSDFRLYQGGLPNLANPDAGFDGFPFFLYTPLIRPEERYNFYTFTTFHINENLTFHADLMYRYGFSHNQLAPAAVPVPSLGAIVIPATNYWNQKIFGENAVPITAGGWRLLGLGPRLDENEVSDAWFNTGFEGKCGDWKWSALALYTQDFWEDREGNSGSLPKLNELLALTTPDAFNPFTSLTGTNASLWDQIRVDAYDRQRTRLTNLQATLSNDNLYQMSAGAIKGVVEVEWNKFRAYDHPDALVRATPLGFNGTPNNTDGDRTTWGVSAEVDVPIMKELSTRLAGRQDHYSDFGGVSVGQGSIRYQPTKELLLRGSWGQGFLAPSILQLHEGQQVNNPTFLDPSAKNSDGSWGANTQVNITRVGNPKLQPEHSHTWDLGVAWSPQAVKNLTFTLDYWNIVQTDVVSSAEDYASIIAERFWQALGSSDAARDAAARNPTSLAAAVAQIYQQTGVTVLWEPDGGPDGLGGLSQNNTAIANVYRTNLAGVKTHGYDLGVQFSYDVGNLGTFGWDTKATYQQSFQYQALQGEPFLELAGFYKSSFEGAWPKWRVASTLSWKWKNLDVNATWHHINHIALIDGVDPTFGNDHLYSYDTWDFNVGYVLPWTKTQILIGVENAFDKLPPRTSFATNNFVGAGTYDVKGCFYYARVTQKF